MIKAIHIRMRQMWMAFSIYRMACYHLEQLDLVIKRRQQHADI